MRLINIADEELVNYTIVFTNKRAASENVPSRALCLFD